MKASQIRAKARQSLASKWGKSALTTLILLVTIYLLSRILKSEPLLGYFAFIIITVPLFYGFITTLLDLNNSISDNYFDLFSKRFFSLWKSLEYLFSNYFKAIISNFIHFELCNPHSIWKNSSK